MEFFKWAAVAILAGGLLLALWAFLSELTRALSAMWLPIAIVIGAALLLFFNDQGRELGVGLMNSPGLRLLALFVVLIYWALNNWHSARLGLDHLYKGQLLTGKETWVYWPPRFLGVCAHLLAALSLALAARNQPAFIEHGMAWIAFAAPLAIILAAALFWAGDYVFTSRRNEARSYKRLARNIFFGCLFFEIVLLVGLLVALRQGRIPDGFFSGTAAIIASAAAFLLLINYLRRGKPDGTDETHSKAAWTIILFLPVLAAFFASIFVPMQLGRAFGSMIVCFFAFGAVLASVTFFWLMMKWTADYLSDRWPRTTQRGVAEFALVFLLALAVGTSLIRPFHRVRTCEKDVCPMAPVPHEASSRSAIKHPADRPTVSEGAPAPQLNADPRATQSLADQPTVKDWQAIQSPADRPTVKDAALNWYRQAVDDYAPLHQGEPIPMLVVAAAGGGIRAAVWTAAILERLEHDLARPENPRELRHLLFAISAVSGGSVGASAYVAAAAKQEADGTAAEPVSYLAEDFLAPGLVSWVFVDGPSNILPDLNQGDRGVALEQGFEHASGGLLADAFLSFFPDTASAARHWRPILLLNATHQETGRRIITSNVKIERHVFQDSYDALQILGADVRASTASHNSARFTYVSPAGNLAPQHKNRGYVIDGGYFDNYGAATALEISREAERAIKQQYGDKSVRRVVLLISSDPGLDEARARVRLRQRKADGQCVLSTATPADTQDADNYFPFKDATGSLSNDGEKGVVFSSYNELTAPLFGVMSVREAHGTRAAEELAAEICAEQPVSQAAPKAADQSQKVAANLAAAADATLLSTQPLPARADGSFFAHLAMCDAETNDMRPPPAAPPLGWVLSTDTRTKIGDFLSHCDNNRERAALETALGVKELH
ncbi:hypothetical protein Msil_0816 [Methylocella silvestris BL2]|uniref:PNPLA domain-containing protein n=1 Tax=Methylocella silvestris (strain DSM 15510 / CIP 108128 / LMG 27833 / NCIMB 13906 / BL2) TaxID=395965 RepID=B8ER41_METSB|nr:hypothetical protein [Methylocella silvestris]ACK49786.1 hypothetical protein Msil_0816 [Methylocella silvestris BL2]